MKKNLLAFASLFLISFGAKAGFLIDPYFGYIASGSNSIGVDKISGTDMGIRLGYSKLGLGVGADVTLGGTYTLKDPSSSTDFTPSHMGLFVSYKFPILVRGYATYFVNSKITGGGVGLLGNGLKLGVQYTGLPFVAIGLETYSMNYTEAEAFGIKVPFTGSETQTRLALSVPFDI